MNRLTRIYTQNKRTIFISLIISRMNEESIEFINILIFQQQERMVIDGDFPKYNTPFNWNLFCVQFQKIQSPR